MTRLELENLAVRYRNTFTIFPFTVGTYYVNEKDCKLIVYKHTQFDDQFMPREFKGVKVDYVFMGEVKVDLTKMAKEYTQPKVHFKEISLSPEDVVRRGPEIIMPEFKEKEKKKRGRPKKEDSK